mgnify:CR=1 FL=1
MAVFGGNRERMREMAFGSQELNEYEETNGHIIRQPEIERWAKDIYGFVCREFGEENVASFIVHLDETGPHAHCVGPDLKVECSSGAVIVVVGVFGLSLEEFIAPVALMLVADIGID